MTRAATIIQMMNTAAQANSKTIIAEKATSPTSFPKAFIVSILDSPIDATNLNTFLWDQA